MQKRLECFFFPLQRFCSPSGTVVVVCVCETLSNIQLLLFFYYFSCCLFFFFDPLQDKAEKSLLSLCLFAIAPLCLCRRCSRLLVFFFLCVYTRTRKKKKERA